MTDSDSTSATKSVPWLGVEGIRATVGNVGTAPDAVKQRESVRPSVQIHVRACRRCLFELARGTSRPKCLLCCADGYKYRWRICMTWSIRIWTARLVDKMREAVVGGSSPGQLSHLRMRMRRTFLGSLKRLSLVVELLFVELLPVCVHCVQERHG